MLGGFACTPDTDNAEVLIRLKGERLASPMNEARDGKPTGEVRTAKEGYH
jgi:hypothetical protein